MSRARSDLRRAAAGFTLIEVIIGVVVSGILVLVITRFFNDSHRAYNLQDRVADRDQNAQWVIKRLEERIMEAGANLPEDGWPVIVPGSSRRGGFSLGVNPRGGTQTMYSDRAPAKEVPIDDGTAFRGANAVLVLRNDKKKPVEKIRIDAAYRMGGYSQGVKDGNGGQDTLRLEQTVDLEAGDAIYAYVSEDYAVQGTEVSMGGMVLAEDIEAVELEFYDSAGTSTSDWNAMHSAKVSVTARTRLPDPGYQGDGYRRVTLNSEVRMRNRP
jgi:prepilin-type N-terminal cleavage/methylation domain-containing protein